MDRDRAEKRKKKEDMRELCKMMRERERENGLFVCYMLWMVFNGVYKRRKEEKRKKRKRKIENRK